MGRRGFWNPRPPILKIGLYGCVVVEKKNRPRRWRFCRWCGCHFYGSVLVILAASVASPLF